MKKVKVIGATVGVCVIAPELNESVRMKVRYKSCTDDPRRLDMPVVLRAVSCWTGDEYRARTGRVTMKEYTSRPTDPLREARWAAERLGFTVCGGVEYA